MRFGLNLAGYGLGRGREWAGYWLGMVRPDCLSIKSHARLGDSLHLHYPKMHVPLHFISMKESSSRTRTSRRDMFFIQNASLMLRSCFSLFSKRIMERGSAVDAVWVVEYTLKSFFGRMMEMRCKSECLAARVRGGERPARSRQNTFARESVGRMMEPTSGVLTAE